MGRIKSMNASIVKKFHINLAETRIVPTNYLCNSRPVRASSSSLE